jgi:peptidoglycan hydrolase-like protein with peptidoglycan-binding domain
VTEARREPVPEAVPATPAARVDAGPSPALARTLAGAAPTPGAVLELQRLAGNAATRAMLQRAPLTTVEKEKNLWSPLYAGDTVLESAYDESPPLANPSRGDAVGKVQQGLVDDGFRMPKSFRNGKPDKSFRDETEATVSAFQAKHGLEDTGAVGRETMGKLDELAQTTAIARDGPEVEATDEELGKKVVEGMKAVNDPSTFTATSGVWYAYNYFAEHQTDPDAYPWDEKWRRGYAPPEYWEWKGFMHWVLKPNKSASEAIKAWLHGLTIAECLTTIIAIELNTLRQAIGDSEFDNRYGSSDVSRPATDRLVIRPKREETSLRQKMKFPMSEPGADAGVFGKRNVKVGDWVYFFNHPKYLLKHPGGAWQGENAVYVGDNKAGKQLFTGLGAAGKDEDAMLDEMVEAYNRERTGDDYVVLLNTYAPHAPELLKPEKGVLDRDVDYLKGLYEKYKDKIDAKYREDSGEFRDQIKRQDILDAPEYELLGDKRKGGFVAASTKRLDTAIVGAMRPSP